jgi:hypothetical protein
MSTPLDSRVVTAYNPVYNRPQVTAACLLNASNSNRSGWMLGVQSVHSCKRVRTYAHVVQCEFDEAVKSNMEDFEMEVGDLRY